MPQLKARVEKLEDVEEPFRKLYVEDVDNGGHKLDVEGFDDIDRLKKTLGKVRGEAKIAEKIRKLFPDVDAEEIEDAVKAAVAAAKKAAGTKSGKKDGESEDDFEKRVAARVAEQVAEYTPKLEEGEKAKGQLRRFHIDRAASEALDAAGVMADRRKAALKLVREHLDYEPGETIDEDGDVFVRDDKGERRGVKLVDFVAKEFKKNEPYLFAGTHSSGSGTRHATRTSTTDDASKMSPTDKIRVGLEQRNGR
jgi:hypothetical protein